MRSQRCGSCMCGQVKPGTTECQGRSTGHSSSHVHVVSATGIDCESMWVRACEHAESVHYILTCQINNGQGWVGIFPERVHIIVNWGLNLGPLNLFSTRRFKEGADDCLLEPSQPPPTLPSFLSFLPVSSHAGHYLATAIGTGKRFSFLFLIQRGCFIVTGIAPI